MQVVNRRRRNTYSPNTARNLVRNAKPTDKVGSRFAALYETENIIELEDDSLNVGVTEGDMEAQHHQSDYVSEGHGINGVGDGSSSVLTDVVNGGHVSMGDELKEAPYVAARCKVVGAPSVLPTGKHRAVIVVDDGGGHMAKVSKGRVLQASIRGSQAKAGNKLQLGIQGGAKVDHKSRKSGNGVSRNTTADHLSLLIRELDTATVTEAKRIKPPHGGADLGSMGLNWRLNSVFEQPSETDIQV
ncbi:hypothetical protein V6N13_039848 [Hibiscus sabdariffa]